MSSIVFERRDKNGYARVDWGHYLKVAEARISLGKKSIGEKSNHHNSYEKIPKHKMFNFLRKAFKKSPWFTIKKFKFKHWNDEQIVENFYWEYVCCGYVLKVRYYNVSPDGEKIYGIMAVKDVNCIEPMENIIDMSEIVVVEKIS